MTIDFNTVMLLCIAGLNAVTALLVFKTNRNVAIVEKATNSIMAAHLDERGKASRLEGLEAGRAEGVAKAATLAEGKLQGPSPKSK